MSSLREVKDRIASVRSTLKITSAMKLVASSKLRRAQRAIEALRPYEETLNAILAAAGGCTSREVAPEDFASPRDASAVTEGPATASPLATIPLHPQGTGGVPPETPCRASLLAISAAGSGLRPSNAEPSSPSPVTSRGGAVSGSNSAFSDPGETKNGVSGSNSFLHDPEVASATEVGGSSVILSEAKDLIVTFASNSSMCGAFNANVVKKALEVAGECKVSGGAVELWAFGRKMAEGLRKAGYVVERDLSQLVSHPSFDEVAALAAELRERYEAGEVASVVLVYNHFVSTGKQEVVVEPYLAAAFAPDGSASRSYYKNASPSLAFSKSLEVASATEVGGDFIVEPSRAELVQTLLPQILNLKLYAALLDSAASEHAARMIAMQAATDNAEELLGELTLEYNKGRQQKITAEILDLVGAEA